MVEEIRTERLVLRRARLDDVHAMHSIMRNPDAMRFWSTLPHERLEQTEAWLRDMIDGPAHGGDDFLVELDGRVIGKMGGWRLPEIGYLLDPAVWGRGYAYEGLRAYVDYRRGCGSTELTADTDPRNTASRRLLEKCGFVETGHAANTWFIGGEWFDSIYYRLEL
ncbi:GNAT family protein [Sphingomonas arenae]|uniref:GNAT family N-acetyltransferase n=1 Tax=Sphingomonas arenae TaxID=2812555 RepID=UPI00301334BA